MSWGFLLDTSVLSMLAPGKPSPGNVFANWMRTHSAALHISAVTIAEIEQGICKLRRLAATERAASLTRWLDAVTEGGVKCIAVGKMMNRS